MLLMLLFLLKSQTVTLAKVVFRVSVLFCKESESFKEIVQWPEMKLTGVARYSLVNS